MVIINITKLEPEWTLEDSIIYIQNIQKQIRNLGYHAALCGSVLNVGYSYNDLDIAILPLGGDEAPKSSKNIRIYLSGMNAEEMKDNQYISETHDLYRLIQKDNKIIDFLLFR